MKQTRSKFRGRDSKYFRELLSQMCSRCTGMETVMQSIYLPTKGAELDVWVIFILVPFRELVTICD